MWFINNYCNTIRQNDRETILNYSEWKKCCSGNEIFIFERHHALPVLLKRYTLYLYIVIKTLSIISLASDSLRDKISAFNSDVTDKPLAHGCSS